MRKRKDKTDNWLPTRVYKGKSAYEYHPKSGGAVRLAKLDTPRWEVIKKYDELMASFENKSTLTGLVTEFFASADFNDLSKTTQSDYQKYAKKILAVFGKLDAKKLQPKHVRKYMDKRGVKSKVQANREKAFLSRCYRWAFERGIVDMNPCTGVRAFKESARERYIENWEYDAVYKHAPLHIQVAMEISYLCATRKSDVLNMRWSQVLEEGIFISQGKTNVKQIKEWSERLRKAIENAKRLRRGNVVSQWVICQKNGRNYTGRGFDQGWMDARDAARKETGMALDFTFHDIKAKSVSDFVGTSREKQEFTGHKTERQVATYDRKVKVVPTLGSRKNS